MELKPSDVGDKFRSQVTTQQYGKHDAIDGVSIVELKNFVDDGGSFAEIARLNQSGHLEAFPQFQVRQVSHSLMEPGSIKAFHLHYNQDDIWYVAPSDRLLVGLVDTRKDSKTYNQSMRLVLGAGKAQLLFIPHGVAHGGANVSNRKVQVFYFVNQQFDPKNPDEQRLPWDVLGSEFWQINKG